MGNNLVLLDADFCNLILKKPDNISFFKAIFDILDKKPAIHIYIFKHELLNNIHIQTLVKEGFIKIIEYDDFLASDFDKHSYKIAFEDFYMYINGKELNNFNIFIDRRAKHNLGEIHSLITAQYLNIPLFMSNDHGAKELVKSKINTSMFKIDVHNAKEVIEYCKSIEPNKLDNTIARSIIKNFPS